MFKLYSYPLQSKPRTDCLFDAFVKCPKIHSPGKVTTAACFRQFQFTKLHILNKTLSWVCIWLHHLAVKNKAVYFAFCRTKTWSAGNTARKITWSTEICSVYQGLFNSYLCIQPCTKFPQTKEIFSFCKTVIVLQMLRHHQIVSADRWLPKA